MKLKTIAVKNFRLLDDISINIEDDITLIVGKNNTGKTSLFEVVNMFFIESSGFSFHDFSLSCYQQFANCLTIYETLLAENNDKEKENIERILINAMPKIELSILLKYDKESDSLINVSEFINDLDDTKNDVVIRLVYESKETQLLFKSFMTKNDKGLNLNDWLNENITKHYAVRCYAANNLIEDNFRKKIYNVLKFESIQASRKLDDTKADKNKTLAVGFSDYYREVNKDNNEDVSELERQLKGASSILDKKYEKILEQLLKRLKLFGIEPHLTIPEIVLQSGFDPENILRNNIKYYYKQDNIALPENFNGLGYSNLIYLVLKVVSFIEKFKKVDSSAKAEVLTILIEEPEAHLHPQMQQVFISQVKRTIKDARLDEGVSVQIIISTHSSHIVTEAGIDIDRSFERIRYFTKVYIKENKRFKISVKDFNEFKHNANDDETFRFLKQYMSLHRCDIFFADKVILVEGTTERLLLPLMISKAAQNLNNEYLSIIEVGGAYTVKFKDLLKFINIKCLVITDLDSVDPANNRSACPTDREDALTSNSTLLNWLPKKRVIEELKKCQVVEKFDTNLIRVAYQSKEEGSDYVARSLEEAIIHCNMDFFKNEYDNEGEKAKVCDCFSLFKGRSLSDTPFELAPDNNQKTDFTFDLMVFDEVGSKLEWRVPKYIRDGLEWLAGKDEAIASLIESIRNKKVNESI